MRVAVVVAALFALGGCGEERVTACPASATVVLPNVVVRVDTEPGAASVVLRCLPACDRGLAGDDRTELTAPVGDGVAGFDVFADPAAVVVTVLDAGGAELASLETELDWRRVGGSAQCGGPMVATVRVP